MRCILASAHVETQFIASYLLRHSLRLICYVNCCVTYCALSISLSITPCYTLKEHNYFILRLSLFNHKSTENLFTS